MDPILVWTEDLMSTGKVWRQVCVSVVDGILQLAMLASEEDGSDHVVILQVRLSAVDVVSPVHESWNIQLPGKNGRLVSDLDTAMPFWQTRDGDIHQGLCLHVHPFPLVLMLCRQWFLHATRHRYYANFPRSASGARAPLCRTSDFLLASRQAGSSTVLRQVRMCPCLLQGMSALSRSRPVLWCSRRLRTKSSLQQSPHLLCVFMPALKLWLKSRLASRQACRKKGLTLML